MAISKGRQRTKINNMLLNSGISNTFIANCFDRASKIIAVNMLAVIDIPKQDKIVPLYFL